MPEISIITPTYNRSKCLGRLWNSLKGQSPDFEWIVVDDGSQEDIKSVVEGFADVRIRYHRLAQNRGLAGARNAGTAVVRGLCVTFIDDDDEMCQGALEDMVRTLGESGPEIGAVAYADVSGETGKKVSVIHDGAVLGEKEIVCQNAFNSPLAFVYRRSVVDSVKFDEDLRGSADGLWLRKVSKEYKFLMVDRPAVVYHRDPNSMQGSKNMIVRSASIAEAHERVLRNHAEILMDYPRAATFYLMAALYRYGVAGNRRAVLSTFRRVVRYHLHPRDALLAIALLGLGLVGSAWFDAWRTDRKLRNFGH
jgi:glycosyltransferase involved in cell wall biosynthesis